MRKLAVILAAGCALGACATNTMEPAARVAAVDPANPLFHPMFMTMAASSDQFEIQSSQLALQASQNPAVRNFANMMIAHHTATTQNLAAAAQSAGLVPPPPQLVPQHQALLDQLRAAGSGASFDAAYKQAQIQSHTEALQLMQGYANGGDVPALRQVAAAAVPIVTQHLQQAQNLNIMAMQPVQQPAYTAPVRSGERG